MLVLSRRKGKNILAKIDGKVVEFVILHIHNGNVRIGINAPLDVKIVRGEIDDDEPVENRKKPRVHQRIGSKS